MNNAKWIMNNGFLPVYKEIHFALCIIYYTLKDMEATELKKTIHQLVDSVSNELTLVDLYAIVSLVVEQQDLPLDTDTALLEKRLKQIPESITRGQYTTNEEMKQLTKQWLSK
jgi:hypothetical protein